MTKHSHYHKDVSRLSSIDIYRVLDLFAVTDPCVQHAVKKLLCAGVRGSKTMSIDIQEAIDTLERWKAMRDEDQAMPAEFGQQNMVEPASAIDDEGIKMQLVGQSGELSAEVYAAIDLDALRKRAPFGATHYIMAADNVLAAWYREADGDWYGWIDSPVNDRWISGHTTARFYEMLIKL